MRYVIFGIYLTFSIRFIGQFIDNQCIYKCPSLPSNVIVFTGCTCTISYCSVIHTQMGFQLGKTHENNTLKYIFVTKSQCPNVQTERAGLAGRQVMGTLQVHAVIRLSVGGIVVKDTTCFCDACFSNCKVEPVCEGWKIDSTVK